MTRKKRAKVPLMVGIDQSKAATGIVVCRYHPVGGPRDLIHNETVKRVGLKKAWNLTNRIVSIVSEQKATVFAIAREEGYFDKKFPDVHGEIERLGGWFESMFYHHYPEARIHRFLALKWRQAAWGHTGSGGTGWNKLSREARESHLKATSLIWARATFSEIADHHQADAMGILCAHGKYLTERGFIIF